MVAKKLSKTKVKVHSKRRKSYYSQYREEHREELREYQAKYRKTHKKEMTANQKRYEKRHKLKIKLYKRKSGHGITSKSKCINGCKVPWYILQKHHLRTGTVCFCPNCHYLYHWKHGTKRI